MANRPPITSESEIQAHIRLALGRIPGLVLWRNSTGVAERNGRVQHFGLCKGSSDLIGIYATVGGGYGNIASGRGAFVGGGGIND